jgi:hypothetical protein
MPGSVDDDAFSGPIFGGDYTFGASEDQPYAFGQPQDAAGGADGGGSQPYAFGANTFGPTESFGGAPTDTRSLGQRWKAWLSQNLGDDGSADAAAGGSGQTGALADKLKTALAGMKGAAEGPAQPAAGQPGSAWPFGRPGAGAASQVRGSAPPGLASMIQLLQQRRQQFLQQGGRLPSGAPGGGLLGM